jgi:hypothetical protein
VGDITVAYSARLGEWTVSVDHDPTCPTHRKKG